MVRELPILMLHRVPSLSWSVPNKGWMNLRHAPKVTSVFN